MKIHLIAVGKNMPAWVNTAYEEYAKRLPRECSLHLLEIRAGKRGKNTSTPKVTFEEGENQLTSTPKGSHIIALDERGNTWNTLSLAQELKGWQQNGQDVSLLVGGPDGLAPSCLDSAHQHWSLSPLTLPHPLVRVIIAEQLYRAWTLLTGHPYHRG